MIVKEEDEDMSVSNYGTKVDNDVKEENEDIVVSNDGTKVDNDSEEVVGSTEEKESKRTPTTANEGKVPRLFRLLFHAYNHILDKNIDKANLYWERVGMRVNKHRTFQMENESIPEVQFMEDGTRLAIHLAIQHAAPYSIIETIVGKYKDGCSAVYDDMLPLQIACTHPKITSRELISTHLRDDTEWEDVIMLLMKTYPTAIDAGKNPALHLLLEHNPSLNLVKNMIDLHANKISCSASATKTRKKRSKKNCLLKMKDEERQLPLHVAIEYTASDDIILYILQLYPIAARCQRGIDEMLPLHCAVSFGCSGRVLKKIILAFPDALFHRVNDGNTPLHLLFDIETNIKRWSMAGKSDDYDGNELLSESAICELLLEYIPHVKMISTMKIQNNMGDTVVQAAKKCADRFNVPYKLIKLLKNAESGVLTTQRQDSGVNANLSTHNPFTLTTDEGSNSESDSSVDDKFVKKSRYTYVMRKKEGYH